MASKSKCDTRLIDTVPAFAEEASGSSYSVVLLRESLFAQGQVVTLAALHATTCFHASWVTVVGAEAGTRYLLSIVEYTADGGSRPVPPWHTEEI